MGYIVLEGGAEFQGHMADVDRRSMALAGGDDARVNIIPAAAAPDHNQDKAGNNGVSWFRKLGARHVHSLPLVDRASANDPAISETLRQSHLIFLLGGFPGYLAETLANSRCWEAMLDAEQSGGVIAGSSAGAMVLCETYYDPFRKEILKGLNLIPGTCVLPHHGTYGSEWAGQLQEQLPDTVLIGIPEETGVINEGRDGAWQVYGKADVTLYRHGRRDRFVPGREFQLL